VGWGFWREQQVFQLPAGGQRPAQVIASQGIISGGEDVGPAGNPNYRNSAISGIQIFNNNMIV
jgi:hypothetical protein